MINRWVNFPSWSSNDGYDSDATVDVIELPNHLLINILDMAMSHSRLVIANVNSLGLLLNGQIVRGPQPVFRLWSDKAKRRRIERVM
jgi:hypothetical protein